MEQVLNRKNFRNVSRTRGSVISEESKIPSFEEALKSHPAIAKLL